MSGVLRVTDAAGVRHEVAIEGEGGPRIDDAKRRRKPPRIWHELATMGDADVVVVHNGSDRRVYPVGPKIARGR